MIDSKAGKCSATGTVWYRRRDCAFSLSVARMLLATRCSM